MFELLFHPEAFAELEELTPIMKAKALSALDKLEKQGNQLRFHILDQFKMDYLN